MFAPARRVPGYIRPGRMRALGVSRRPASPAIPGIPGAEAAGLPNYEYTFWFGLYVPAGTPPAIVKRLYEAAAKGLARQEVKEKIAIQGMDASPSPSPESFAADIRAEAPGLEQLVRDSGAKVE